MKLKNTLIAGGIAVIATATAALAGPLQDRIDAGETIRIGFANIPLWGYPNEEGNADGFTNDIAIQTLAKMGLTNVEAVVTDWGGLIPGLKAERFDMITGGMYILGSRCENVSFSEPVAASGDGILVAAGNPKGINNYTDILDGGHIMVTGAGYNTVEAAQNLGIADSNIMQVPGPTEMVAAMKAGRADAAVLTDFEAQHLAADHAEIELADSSQMEEWSKNFAGIGFRHEDKDFLAEFNTALGAYIGTDEMMAVVGEHEYTSVHLPGDVTAEWACANR
ncbi:transporter substrate-binding domain-containing protein [uncultured Sulfitobacter sp.]|uniref:transporter substrate-binding domain-containing protein n=1 Tax=uncultured Sulfitobacter sp. TaxID=191468 RepID=UPI002612E53A|nr:transporter substrate-binding domain-containing protein [uncultured Sulfitobacter sp.]